MKAAEDRARQSKLRIWTLPENQQQVEAAPEEEMIDDHRMAAAGTAANASAYPSLTSQIPVPMRTPDYKTVYVTEVMAELRFYVQFVDQGMCTYVTG